MKKERYNILLLNDDGCKSILSDKLGSYLDRINHVKVFKVFPANNVSCGSFSFTLNNKISYVYDKQRYIVNGTSLDCYYFGRKLIETGGEKVDLIISGPNNGLNFGTTRKYSSTFCGAREAFDNGCSALSISIKKEDDLNEQIIEYIIWMMEFVLMHIEILHININFFSSNIEKVIDDSNIDKNFRLQDTLILDDYFIIKPNKSNLIEMKNSMMLEIRTSECEKRIVFAEAKKFLELKNRRKHDE